MSQAAVPDRSRAFAAARGRAEERRRGDTGCSLRGCSGPRRPAEPPRDSQSGKRGEAGGRWRALSTDMGNAQRMVALFGKDLRSAFLWMFGSSGMAGLGWQMKAARWSGGPRWLFSLSIARPVQAVTTKAQEIPGTLGDPLRVRDKAAQPGLSCTLRTGHLAGRVRLRSLAAQLSQRDDRSSSGELRPHRREDVRTKTVPVDFDPVARYFECGMGFWGTSRGAVSKPSNGLRGLWGHQRVGGCRRRNCSC